jgi:hypothetical protein
MDVNMIDLSTVPEAQLKALLTAYLQPDFLLFPEEPGKHVIYGDRVIADFLAIPKPHLIQNGFDEGYFVIEVKSPGNVDREKKFRETVAQAVSYLHSGFDRFAGFPMFSLIFPSLGEYAQGKSEHDRDLMGGVYRLMQFLGVGSLGLDDRNGETHWSITGTSNNYYTSRYGKGKANVFRRPIGNFHVKRNRL